ncbi:MAG: hypothetical protein PHH83_03630 [Patescibacteria group bacterium]|nr:hypothetical protein [Patescibacteria group bacterium]
MENILTDIYPPEGIFIQNYSFDDRKLSIDVICKVVGKSYTTKPVPYVTAENYLRCLSQACYLLADHIIEKKLVNIDISLTAFRDAAINYELYYRNVAMTFHKRTGVEETFQMTFQLTNFKEIKRLQDFILFTFINKRTVISGEMSFIFENKQ